MKMSAEISPCGFYRYALCREWDPFLPKLVFVMLNPSAADAFFDDPTTRRCIGFARREGCGGIVVGNVFAWRALSPRALPGAATATGPLNHAALGGIARRAKRPVVCAWGNLAGAAGAVAAAILRDNGASLVCLGRTASGAPRHPLYVRADARLEPFSSP